MFGGARQHPLRCGALVLSLCGAPAAAQPLAPPADSSEVLARQLIAPRRSPWTPDLAQLLAMMSELPLRFLFKSLYTGPEWGPQHARWDADFGLFRQEYLRLVAIDLARVERELPARLAARFDATQMRELLQLFGDPELDRILKSASGLGLDLGVALRAANLSAAPEHFSAAEKAQVHAELLKLRGKEAGMQAVAARMQVLGQRFEVPLVGDFQRILVAALRPIAEARVDADGFSARFEPWLAAWRARIRIVNEEPAR
jgi:hypothetical protein